MNLRSYRRTLFTLALVLDFAAVAVAVGTGIPSVMSLSVLLIAVTAWAYGPVAALATIAACRGSEFVVLSLTGGMMSGHPPLAILIPVIGTDLIVLTAAAALRRAELRQSATEAALRTKNAELAVALAEVKELRGMLPICAWCKSVRDVDGMWDRLECYLSKHSHATLTHGICPDCMTRMEAEWRARAG